MQKNSHLSISYNQIKFMLKEESYVYHIDKKNNAMNQLTVLSKQEYEEKGM
jgi:hypothetical protein